MKKFLFACAAIVGLFLTVLAADSTPPHTYEGTITGVVCSSCKEHITYVLTKKLPGFVSVDVKPSDNPDVQKLVIVATNPNVTKESATSALGSLAKNYQILSLAEKN